MTLPLLPTRLPLSGLVLDADARQSDPLAAQLGTLPEWDLTDLYASPDAPELTRDLDELERACATFAADYEGRLADLTPAEMLECVERYQVIDILAGRIMSYVGLRYYQNTTDAGRAKMLGDMQAKITDFTTPLVFFSLEFNRIPDDQYEQVFSRAVRPVTL